MDVSPTLFVHSAEKNHQDLEHSLTRYPATAAKRLHLLEGYNGKLACLIHVWTLWMDVLTLARSTLLGVQSSYITRTHTLNKNKPTNQFYSVPPRRLVIVRRVELEVRAIHWLDHWLDDFYLQNKQLG